MSKLPPPMNLEGMNLEAIHEAIQDCHDWPGRNHPDDTYHLGMRAVCTAMRLESALEAAQQEIAARDAEIADLKRGGVDAAELDAISDAIRCIGNDAHHASTGPVVPDALWGIRSRAYDVCARIDGIRTIPADRVLGEGDVKVSAKAIEQASKTLDSLVMTSWARGDHEEKMVTELCAAFRPIACAATCAKPTQEPTL